MEPIDVDGPPNLTADQRQWAIEHEALWRRAIAIADRHPGMDISGVYHVLCNLRRTPEERLRRGLHGRLKPDRA
jgi:hypothetical protein